MDLKKILVVTMLASGFAVAASFHVEENLNDQEWEVSPESNPCGFCYYYLQTGHGPYEVLWKLGLEIRPHMSHKSQILMLLDPGRLKVAEYIFNDYCLKFCGKESRALGQVSSDVSPCQMENGIVGYE